MRRVTELNAALQACNALRTAAIIPSDPPVPSWPAMHRLGAELMAATAKFATFALTMQFASPTEALAGLRELCAARGLSSDLEAPLPSLYMHILRTEGARVRQGRISAEIEMLRYACGTAGSLMGIPGYPPFGAGAPGVVPSRQQSAQGTILPPLSPPIISEAVQAFPFLCDLFACQCVLLFT